MDFQATQPSASSAPTLSPKAPDCPSGSDAPYCHCSTATAVASPPPMQSEAMPRLLPYFSIAASNVTRMRAPDAPMGWPNAQAPPCTLTLSWGKPRSRMAHSATTANASLISYRPTSPGCQPTCSSNLLTAATGAVVNQAGACAALLTPMMRATGSSLRRLASAARISTSAAAPSEME